MYHRSVLVYKNTQANFKDMGPLHTVLNLQAVAAHIISVDARLDLIPYNNLDLFYAWSLDGSALVRKLKPTSLLL